MATEKRLIDANRFLRVTRFQEGVYPHKTLKMEIEEQPTIDTVEVVHGRWMKDKTVQVMAPGGQKYHNSCSVCGWLTRLHNLNYCPNCGAKMDGDGNG